MKKIIFAFQILILFHGSLFADDAKEEPPKLKSNFVYAGYSSLIPGLGQVKKDRMYTGIFFFAAFGASAYNWMQNFDRFQEAEKSYQSKMLWLNLYYSSSDVPFFQSYLITTLVANQSFAQYNAAETKTNQALQYTAIIYLFQVVHAYFCSPGNAFDRNVETKSIESSGFQLNAYPVRNPLGQIGTNVDINYKWRF